MKTVQGQGLSAFGKVTEGEASEVDLAESGAPRIKEVLFEKGHGVLHVAFTNGASFSYQVLRPGRARRAFEFLKGLVNRRVKATAKHPILASPFARNGTFQRRGPVLSSRELLVGE